MGGVAVSGWGGAYSIDDSFLALAAPFPITMYGYTTSNPSVQSNGVSNRLILCSK